MQTLKLRSNAKIRPGHPWIYKSQLERPETCPPGELVKVQWAKGFYGIGYGNPASEITVRLLTRRDEPVDAAFIRAKIRRAAAYRERWITGTNACRLISSEADGLPGLIVDRYGDILVVQFLTLGMEKLREAVLAALDEISPSKGVYEKSESSSRRIEGLQDRSGWIRRDCGEETEIIEGGIRYKLRFGEGHKTGFYLDQRENRLALAADTKTGRVLDAFAYEGAFSLHLARAGAEVTAVEIQSDAVKRGEEHRAANGIDPTRLRFVQANAFDELKRLEREKAQFDLVILDPPSFVKKKAAIEGAVAGYKEILLRSMKILVEGGRLAVFSCSYHIDDTLLLQTSMSAAIDVRKGLRIVRFLKQSADHPIDPFIPETYYLKGFLFEVTSL